MLGQERQVQVRGLEPALQMHPEFTHIFKTAHACERAHTFGGGQGGRQVLPVKVSS